MDGPDSRGWPKRLSGPSRSGRQNGMRYAFFPGQHRLALAQDGKVKPYDTGAHHISGVNQSQAGQGGNLRFASQTGDVGLRSLKEVH